VSFHINVKQVRNEFIRVVSPRRDQGHMSGAMAADVLRAMGRPPLSEAARTALIACRQREFVNEGSISQLNPLQLGEVSRVLVKHRDGNSLAWLYLRLQRDVTEGARTLRLNVEPASNEAQPLDEDRLGARDIEFVGQWLKTWKPELDTLTDVDLSGNAIDETGLKHLGEILPHVTRLNLRGNIFKAKVDKAFYKALKAAAELEEADLSIKGLHWETLCETLKSVPLKKLAISCKNDSIGPESPLWKHVHLLLGNQHIQHLDLSGQRLCEPSQGLLDALKQNTSLKQFILNDCIPYAKPCLDFIKALGSHKSLQVAGLARLPLHQDCTSLAHHLLSRHCKLKALDLSLPAAFYGEPRVSNPSYPLLFNRLSRNRSLLSLSIAGHPLNDKTREVFLNTLATSRWQTLDIRGCGFTASELEPAIAQNASLTTLRVDDLGKCEERSAIRRKIAVNRLITSAAEGVRRLSGLHHHLPPELAVHVARYAFMYGERSGSGGAVLRNIAIAGRGLRPGKSRTKLRRLAAAKGTGQVETKI
jgi:hypothetical protein